MELNVLEEYPLLDSYFVGLQEQYNLTKREREILQKLSLTGLSNNSLSKQLKISEKTINLHLTNIKKKMQVESYRELQAKVLRKTLPSLIFTVKKSSDRKKRDSINISTLM